MLQPGGTYHLNNSFVPLHGENILKMYECEEGCSNCCGPKTFIALTGNRVIARHQDANRCLCCCEGAHIDTAIYLRDIEILQEAQQQAVGICGPLLVSIVTCTWPIFLLALCCGSCCGDQPKAIAVRGGFGSEVLIFKRPDAIEAANEISTLIQPFKDRR